MHNLTLPRLALALSAAATIAAATAHLYPPTRAIAAAVAILWGGLAACVAVACGVRT